MEFEIDTRSIALPKEALFTNTICMLLKTNGSLSVLKSEIFVKIKNRIKEILPLIKVDFSQVRKISIKNGVIDAENDRTIDEFLHDVKVADVEGYGEQVIEDAFKMTHVLNECQEPFNKVLKAVQEWFKNYLKVLYRKIDVALEAGKTYMSLQVDFGHAKPLGRGGQQSAWPWSGSQKGQPGQAAP